MTINIYKYLYRIRMPITLDSSNIEIQYSTGSNYIIETVKSDLYVRNEIVDNIVRDNIQVAPVTPSLYIENGTNNVYAVESYTYSGSANTADFTRVFPKNTTCDILIVGGGGGGDREVGGGGGGGAVLYATNISIPANTYTIKVGKGGAQNVNGGNSEAFGATCLGGGSTAYVAWGTANNGTAGGSGSGASAGNSTVTGGTVGTSTKGALLNSGTLYNGNVGGNALAQVVGTWQAGGGGGGGAGTAGLNSTQTLYNTRSSWIAGGRPSSGGNGIPINITGTTYYWGAGGGGAGHYGSHAGDGGLGGGGGGGGSLDGGSIAGLAGTDGLNSGEGGLGGTGTQKGGNGAPNTGSGGGGGGYGTSANGGSGGSGIVIIRYLLGTIPSNNLLTTEPVVVAPTFTETIRTFIHSGGAETQTTHTITVGRNTICDILIVGGGGGGDKEIGGGGGGGAVLYATNITIQAGTYQIKVGNGGAQNVNGSSSEAFGATCLGGGSTPFVAWSNGNNGTSGGSGSGGSSKSPSTAPGTTIGGGIGTSTKGTLLASGTLYNGNVGGNSLTADVYHAGGGGGGAGTAGNNSIATGLTKNTTRQSYINSGYPQKGGDGVPINITGTTYYWGAGGGGGTYDTHGGDGGLGGGGGGGASYQLAGLAGTGGINNGGNGVGQRTGAAPWEVGGFGAPNTGSGGGGGGYFNLASGGAGGSGIVIIKFKSTTAILDGITHKRLNFAYNNDNLVAWYKFNGDYLDSSGNGHNLTNVGTVIQSTHIIEGQAVEFDSTDYLEFPATINPYTIWNNGKGITFSCWVRFTAHGLWARLIDFQTAANTNNGIFFSVKSAPATGASALYADIGGTKIFTYSNWSNSLITTLGVWHHFVWSIDVNGKWDIYLNNVRINGTETANIPNISYNLRYINKSAYPDSTWGGQMDDFRIYDRALSATDVSLLYNKTYPIPNLYTLNFPVPTIADINNNSNIILRGAYDIALSTSNALIIPKAGQYIPQPTFSTSNLSIRYHLLNLILDPIGAQWTYSSSNTNVYHMGSVGIGTTNPSYTLDVRGSIFSSTGGFTQSGLTTWSIASDRRIKENIVKASYEKCLENVKNIELYNFNFKDNYVITNDRHQLGFIAQEVQQVYPKAVEVGRTMKNNGGIEDILTLNITQIEYTLYGAVKELIDNIDVIENEVEEIDTIFNITTQ